MHKNRLILVLILMSMCTKENNTAIVLEGNSTDKSSTFTFPINKYVKSNRTNNLYVAAALQPEKQNNIGNFSIAQLTSNTTTFLGLTPELVTLNINKANEKNPLFNTGIRQLALLDNASQGLELPVVVTQQEPNIIYLYEKTVSDTLSILQSDTIKDAQAHQGSELFGLTTDNEAYIFSLIKPQESEFGQPGTGIVGLIRGTLNAGSALRIFQQIDLPTGAIMNAEKVRAFPLDITSSALKIGDNNLALIEQAVSLHWDSVLKRLFIGLRVTTDNNIASGARSVVVARLENNIMTIEPIAPDTVFDTLDDAIIGTVNTHDSLSNSALVNNLKTMHTSTGLHYLIVQGGIATSQNTLQSVYALPLVSQHNNSSLNGTIAAINSPVQDTFAPGPSSISFFNRRDFIVPAVTPQELPRAGHASVLVGQDSLRAGDITDIFVLGDSVFCIVPSTQDISKAGIYYSQALFKADGVIKGWTQWERAITVNNTISGGALNAHNGSFTLLTTDQQNVLNTVVTTLWGQGSLDGFSSAVHNINKFFSNNNSSSSITSSTNFTHSTPGLNNTSLLFVGGTAALALVETGRVLNEVLIANNGTQLASVSSFVNGTIDSLVNNKIVTIAGGALNQIGYITTAEIVVDKNTNQAWLIVAGSGGVAILSNPDGSGWNAQTGIGNNLSSLIEGMSFKIVGNYTDVQKIVYDNNSLYVLTNDALSRTDITSSIGLGKVQLTTLATFKYFALPHTGAFTDIIISQKLALLATTSGLYRVGNNSSIETAFNAQECNWTRVNLAEGLPSVTQLNAVTLTGRSQDATHIATEGSNINVLTAYNGKDQASISRLALESLSEYKPISDTTVMLFNDTVIKNTQSNFLNFGRSAKNYVTDGGVHFTTQDKNSDVQQNVSISSLVPQPHISRPSIGFLFKEIPEISGIGTIVNTLQRNNASGSWLLAGNFGLCTNE